MDNVTLVRSEVAKIPGSQNKGKYSFILCPFHAERTPSCRVNHDGFRPNSAGYFGCYGCPAKGSWNELAEVLNLEKFKGARSSIEPVDIPAFNMDLLEDALKEKVLPKFEIYSLKQSNCERIGLPMKEDDYVWRGFRRKFLADVGTKIAYVKHYGSYFLYLPVNVMSKRRGYILARIEKVEGKSSYINAPGTWSSKTGLYLFDESVELARDHGLRTLVLVEGPRDALRLFREGIPAVAILGTQSWTTYKATLAEHASINRIIVCFDGDKAGKAAARRIIKAEQPKNPANLSEGYVAIDGLKRLDEIYPSVELFALWKREPEMEYDPCNMPRKYVEELRGLL